MTVGLDGTVYAIAGYHTSALATVEAYDAASSSWTTKPSLPVALACAAAVTLPDGRIMVVGGSRRVAMTSAVTRKYTPHQGNVVQSTGSAPP